MDKCRRVSHWDEPEPCALCTETLRAAAPALLEALEAVTAFAFSDVQAKEGYQAALKAFCSLKRKGRAAIALAREEK